MKKMINFNEILVKGQTKLLPGGDSKETFLVNYKRKKFVLRKCSNKKRANELAFICNNLERYDILPKLLYQEGKNLMFEYVKGRACKKSDALKVAQEIGKICALINKLPNKNSFNFDKRFFGYLETLNEWGLFAPEEIKKINKIYTDFRRTIKPKIILDANDVYPENFRLRRGKVYLVDVDAIKPLLKGFGIGKGFVRWFKTPKQRERFKKGYCSIAPVNFLNDNYLKFILLNFLARNISSSIRLNKKVNIKDVMRLKGLVK